MSHLHYAKTQKCLLLKYYVVNLIIIANSFIVLILNENDPIPFLNHLNLWRIEARSIEQVKSKNALEGFVLVLIIERNSESLSNKSVFTRPQRRSSVSLWFLLLCLTLGCFFENLRYIFQNVKQFCEPWYLKNLYAVSFCRQSRLINPDTLPVPKTKDVSSYKELLSICLNTALKIDRIWHDRSAADIKVKFCT